ncbi:hypothetical protein yc1106_03981 [Curvularia clavata]|uniref:Uncharacterized protein n=1 Tax=Curvularia clavata TaxID=95742 RepID=A0A9Q8Z5H7_CURCL|nr:hypothetical protein yc1106_03981 [Curvularia clavata]
MFSRISRNLLRSAPLTSRALPQRIQTFTPFAARTYADGAVPGQSSNVSNPQASSPESQDINHSASIGQTDKNDADHVSIQNPVSHPEQDRAGGSEEGTESQDNMKHDPNESDAKKREKTLGYGQNKPLDAADK